MTVSFSAFDVKAAHSCLVAGALGLTQAMWGGFASDAIVTAIGLLGAVAAFLAYRSIRRTESEIEAAVVSTDAAAGGNLTARLLHINDRGPLGRLLWNVNRLLDVTEAFCKEADAAMQHANDRKYYRSIIVTGLRGDFACHAGSVNRSLATMEKLDADALAFAKEGVQLLVNEVAEASSRLHADVENVVGNMQQALQEARAAASDAAS